MPDDSARLLRSRLTARSATSVSVIAALSAGIGSAVFRSSPEKPTSTAANSQHRTKMIIAGDSIRCSYNSRRRRYARPHRRRGIGCLDGFRCTGARAVEGRIDYRCGRNHGLRDAGGGAARRRSGHHHSGHDHQRRKAWSHSRAHRGRPWAGVPTGARFAAPAQDDRSGHAVGCGDHGPRREHAVVSRPDDLLLPGGRQESQSRLPGAR